jgi:Protein kinase domain
MFAPGTKIRGYTVERAIDAPAGWHELVARGEDGIAVLLRVPPDLDGTERIRSEAVLARKHKHECLLQSLELVEHNGWPVQVLTFVDGLTLEALQVQAGKIAPEAVCRIGRQVGLALVELHERAGVAHGALAADRILIDTGGSARLIDVGCARPMGPKRLQSPERRKEVGRPSVLDDLWGLGVILVDAVLGGAADPSQDLPGFIAQLDTAALPERLGDALKMLVAPVGSRLTNAAAAVRMFTEIEKKLGDGSLALRKAVAETRRTVTAPPREPDTKDDLAGDGADDNDGVTSPHTVPDGVRPFATLMRGLGADPGPQEPITQEPITQEPITQEPVTQEQEPTNPAAPRTVEMTPDRVLDVLQMQRMSQFAEEAARRTSGPVEKPTAAQLLAPAPSRAPLPAPLRKETADELSQVGPPIGARDIHEEETVSDPHQALGATRARDDRATERVPRPAPAPKPPARVEDPNTLDDAERAALGMPASTKIMIAVVVLAFVVGAAIALLRG